MPRWRKGKMQGLPGRGPVEVVQAGTSMASAWQAEVAETSQSPQPLVTTTPALSVAVAHQGVGESE